MVGNWDLSPSVVLVLDLGVMLEDAHERVSFRQVRD